MGQEYIREGKRFLYEESGIGVVEIILILVVLVGLVVICLLYTSPSPRD